MDRENMNPKALGRAVKSEGCSLCHLPPKADLLGSARDRAARLDPGLATDAS
jgi:hypothetical protein